MTWGWRSNWRLELHLDERELVVVGVDHVVLDADGPVIGPPGGELGKAVLLAVEQLQLPCRHGHDHIVVGVAMPAGLGARREAPLRHLHPFVVDLHGRPRRYHAAVCHRLSLPSGYPCFTGPLP